MSFLQTDLFGTNTQIKTNLTINLKWCYECLQFANIYTNDFWWDDFRNACPSPPEGLKDYGRFLSRFLISQGFEKIPNVSRASTIPSRQCDTSYMWRKKGGSNV